MGGEGAWPESDRGKAPGLAGVMCWRRP
jgi:hypothetical protein